MSMSFWRKRPGLAGGIDKDGRQARTLLASGFASVEFGTVTPQPVPGSNPGVAALVAALSGVDRSCGTLARVGVSLGAGIDAAPAALAKEWLAGMRAAWGVADYLCFNLSARAYRPLLAAPHADSLRAAVAAVLAERDDIARRSGRPLPVALKVPLGVEEAGWSGTLAALAGMGVDGLVAVLPEGEGRLGALSRLSGVCHDRTTLVAVGGIRSAADVRAVLAAGAEGVQVHGAFAERGADCLPPLLAGMAAQP